MVRNVMILGFTFTLLGLSTVASADVTAADSLRCEAQKTRKEGQKSMCYAGCMDRASSQLRRGAATTAPVMSDCEAGCDQKCKDAIARINEQPICGGPPADPEKCAEKLLDAEAKSLQCKSRCFDRAQGNDKFDVVACQQSCGDDYRAGRDEILASSICHNGPADTH